MADPQTPPPAPPPPPPAPPAAPPAAPAPPAPQPPAQEPAEHKEFAYLRQRAREAEARATTIEAELAKERAERAALTGRYEALETRVALGVDDPDVAELVRGKYAAATSKLDADKRPTLPAWIAAARDGDDAARSAAFGAVAPLIPRQQAQQPAQPPAKGAANPAGASRVHTPSGGAPPPGAKATPDQIRAAPSTEAAVALIQRDNPRMTASGARALAARLRG